MSRARRSSIPRMAAGSSNNLNSHRAAGLCVGDDLAEADRRRAGRCDRRADGRGRRPRRALLVRRAARDARAEPRPAACEDRRPARDLRRAGRGRARRGQCRADHRHDHLPGHGFLLARHRALDPDRAGDLAHASPRPSGRRKSATLKIKISGCINACGHHHVGHIGILGRREEGRRELPDHGRRRRHRERRGRRHRSATALRPRTCPTRSSGWSTPISRAARAPDEPFIAAFRRLGEAPFKEALYGSA